jgi:anti-sigma factor RsiW
MSRGRPITEDELHAHVDGALDPSRAAEVAEYLARSPDVARRVDGYVRQRMALRAALAPYAKEPVPPELNLARWTERPGSLRIPRWRAAAAAVLLLCVGGASGWVARSSVTAPSTGMAATLAQEAADSYQVFSADQVHAVEFKANDRGALVDWVSERLRRPIAVPDLSGSGYRFMGGRLVATSHGPAGLFLYDDDHGTRLAMLVRPVAIEKDMPMSQHRNGDVDGYAWAAKGLGYSLVGAATPGVLHPLANEVRRQIDKSA